MSHVEQRGASRGVLLATLAVAACGPTEDPTFEGTYAGLDVWVRCLSLDERGAITDHWFIEPLEISRDDDGDHHVTLASIDCPLTARVEGSELRFRPQSCFAGYAEQHDIQGSATFADGGELELHLTDAEFWPPSRDFWPDGLWWDCDHDYELEPLE